MKFSSRSHTRRNTPTGLSSRRTDVGFSSNWLGSRPHNPVMVPVKHEDEDSYVPMLDFSNANNSEYVAALA